MTTDSLKRHDSGLPGRGNNPSQTSSGSIEKDFVIPCDVCVGSRQTSGCGLSTIIAIVKTIIVIIIIITIAIVIVKMDCDPVK